MFLTASLRLGGVCAALWCLPFLAGAQAPLPTAGQPMPLWPQAAPGALGTAPEDIPTLTPFYPATGTSTGAAMIVCPGGGYGMLAAHEGKPVAQWLNTLGITAFVLKYRLGPRYHHPVELEDAQRAIRTVRANAAAWGLDPHRVGILGFSAGGHLTTSAATHFDAGDAAAVDPIARVSSRPDLQIPIYPVVSMGPLGHAGSRTNLLGPSPAPALVTLLSNELQVTADTPPAFIVHTADDHVVPVENSLMYAEALRKAGVAFELHIFQHGPHGFGLGGNDPVLATWPHLCALWLKAQGWGTGS